jgi:hypothetical protein
LKGDELRRFAEQRGISKPELNEALDKLRISGQTICDRTSPKMQKPLSGFRP